MTENVVIAIALAALLIVDWRTRKLVIRSGAVVVCLVLWWFSLPNYTLAARRVTSVPEASITVERAGQPGAEFFRGVSSMREALEAQQRDSLPLRVFAITGLVWLAFSPRLRRRTPEQERMPEA